MRKPRPENCCDECRSTGRLLGLEKCRACKAFYAKKWASNPANKEKIRLRFKKYRLAHLSYFAAKEKARRDKNRSEYNRKKREWLASRTPEQRQKARETNRAYRLKHAGRFKDYERKRYLTVRRTPENKRKERLAAWKRRYGAFYEAAIVLYEINKERRSNPLFSEENKYNWNRRKKYHEKRQRTYRCQAENEIVGNLEWGQVKNY